MSKAILVYDKDLLHYDFGKHHPLRPERVKYTIDLLKAYGAYSDDEIVKPEEASFDDLAVCHNEQFLRVIEQLSSGVMVPSQWEYGFGSNDNPAFFGMWEAASLYVGASIKAAQIVMDDPSAIGINFSGGLHHAQKARASGFCILNDACVAIHHMLRKWDKIVYIDIDVHHGDGVQWLFYNDPRVLTVSIHESGRWLFPGTGDVDEIGEGAGDGFALNAPLAPGTTDELWMHVFEEAVVPIIEAFDPGAIFLQMGADAHYLDPIGQLRLTAQGWVKAVKRVLEMGKPIVAAGGGGYNLTAVPRMWTLAYGALSGIEFDDIIPASFAEVHQVSTLSDHVVTSLGEDRTQFVEEFDESTIAGIKKLMFPRFGLK
jgi:acetoin utilization protein AcuC